jgi:hypothetical protein
LRERVDDDGGDGGGGDRIPFAKGLGGGKRGG